MNCYAGLAKRLVKSCFPEVKLSQVIPVPQLQPLDARNIIKHEVKNINTTKECFTLNEEVLKPISDEEAWALTVAWAEAKAQERETAATKELSQTDTDESYDSDDSDDDYEAIHSAIAMIMQFEEEKRIEEKKKISREKEKSLLKRMLESQSLSGDDTDESYDSDDFTDAALPAPPFVCRLAGLMRVGEVVRANVYSLDDAAAAAAMWRDDAQADAYECVAAKKALEALDKWFPSAARKYTAATIIQAAARGRAVRAWNTFISAPVVSNNDNNGSALVTREVVSHLLWTLRLFGNRISAATVAVTAITALAKARQYKKIIDNEAMVTAARGAVVEWVAATIIQAAERGRAVRAWNAIITHRLSLELPHIYRTQYLKRRNMEIDALEQELVEDWTASPKYAMAWIKLAERRRYVHHF
jgi:hypothetical protein